MVINPENNPWGLPVLELLEESPSLVHIIQSISAAHEHFFEDNKMQPCLQERGLSLKLLRHELLAGKRSLASQLMTILLLGMSSAWIAQLPTSYGQEHLDGARATIDLMLSVPEKDRHPLSDTVFGVFIWWDMMCSFLIEPSQQQALDTPLITAEICRVGKTYNPVAGHALELFYILSLLGRYCRRVIDGGPHDLATEMTFEAQLLAWQSSKASDETPSLDETWRLHGLIMLHRVCNFTQSHSREDWVPGDSEDMADKSWVPENHSDPQASIHNSSTACDSVLGMALPEFGDFDAHHSIIDDMLKSLDPESEPMVSESTTAQNLPVRSRMSFGAFSDSQASTASFDAFTAIDFSSTYETLIQQYALQIIENVMSIPANHPSINVLALPLLTAACELEENSGGRRLACLQRFKAIYATNRLRSNLFAMDLLQGVWDRRDRGDNTFWMKLMLERSWRLSLG